MRRLNGQSKGQFFSVDMVAAVLIFLTILITVSLYWDYSFEKINLIEKRNNMQLVTKSVLSNLIETEGYPSYWNNITVNESNVGWIGLAKGYNSTRSNRATGMHHDGAWILDYDKVYALYNESQNYTILKKVIGVPNYDYELKIYVWDGFEYFLRYESGRVAHNATNVVNLERFALLNDEWAIVKLTVWDKE